MRIYLSLIITAILLSFSTAYFALNLQKDYVASVEEIKSIKALQIEFKNTTKPLIELDLSSIYPTRDYLQLLQPISDPFKSNVSYTKECRKLSNHMTKNQVDKAEVWEAFRCRERLVLPGHFFEYSPFVHESGASYAYLAYTSGVSPYDSIEWIRKHLNFFHVSELKLLPLDSLDERFKILSSLGQNLLDGMIKGNVSLLSEDFYLIQKNAGFGTIFNVFFRIDFEKFLNQKTYYAKSLKVGDKCYYLEGSICWQKDTNNLLQMLRPSSIAIFAISVLILLLVSLSLYSRIKMQNKEEERKRHALRVLTHELRTPIANLLLQIESINKQSDLISPVLMEELLRMEGEVYRLKRLAEKSSNYLNASKEKELIQFDLKLIPSSSELIRNILDDYRGRRVEFSDGGFDHPVVLDVYWFSICLKNLVENALAHGMEPIKVTSSAESGFIRIDVIDQGQFKSRTKNTEGHGLGMGLSIVEKIMMEMKGKLSLSTNPTKFSLFLRNKV